MKVKTVKLAKKNAHKKNSVKKPKVKKVKKNPVIKKVKRADGITEYLVKKIIGIIILINKFNLITYFTF